MLPDDVTLRLDRDGFLIVPDLLGPSEFEQTCAECELLPRRYLRRPSPTSARIERALRSQLGGDVLGGWKLTTADGQPGHWHIDDDKASDRRWHSCVLLFALDDFKPDGGATQLLRGSHTFTERADRGGMVHLNEDDLVNVVTAEAPANSLIVFLTRLVHRAGPNPLGLRRMALMNNHWCRLRGGPR
jgi:ectoine hydroxylase-related dioxygenase (phytanoyl-CoA dioxygenase family)